MRFTSGSGSEVQMEYAEANPCCIWKRAASISLEAAGVQGLQNGSVKAASAYRLPLRQARRYRYWRKPDLLFAGSGMRLQ